MDPAAFAEDMRLIHENAIKYNKGMENGLVQAAKEYLSNFERLFKAWVVNVIAGTSKGPTDADFLLPPPW